MNLRSLRVFILVMEEGTLARASAKMHLSQPAASRLLQILEEELGVSLFFRDKKRLVPTPEGELFLPEAVRILSAIDDVPAFFDQIRDRAVVPLRIISHPRIVNGLVLPAMARLNARLPRLKMKLEIHPRRDLGRRIMHDLYDIGVSTLPLPVEGLTPERLFQTRLHVAFPRDHRLADRKQIAPKDLVGEPYIALDKHTVIRRIADQSLFGSDIQLEPTHEVSTGAAAYRLVRFGMGFTFSDPIAMDPEYRDELALVPWVPESALTIGYFLPQTERRHDAVIAFANCLQEICVEVVPGQ